ncbi:hypothetical protein Ac2012v2_000470 [Leucoagaricus gongylophorus]
MPSPKQNPHSSFVVSNPWQKMSVAQQLYANSLMNHGPSLPTLPPPSFESNAPMTVPNQESFYQTSVSSCIPSVRLPPSSLSTVSSISSSQSSQTTFPHQTYNVASFMPQSPPYSEHSFSDDDQHLDGVNLNRTPLPRGDIEPDVPHLTPMPQPKRNTVFNHNLNPPTRTLFDLKYVNAGENKPKAVRNVITSIHPPPPDPGGGEKVHVDQNMPDELFLHQTLLSPPSGAASRFYLLLLLLFFSTSRTDLGGSRNHSHQFTIRLLVTKMVITLMNKFKRTISALFLKKDPSS